MEKIVKIEETNFNIKDDRNHDRHLEGFKITTDKQEILLGMDSGQSCCETYGYFMSEDDIEQFIGASIISIYKVDECLKVTELPKYLDSGGTMFINIETDKGTLQFTAYNAHNGYYIHMATTRCNQLTYEEYL